MYRTSPHSKPRRSPRTAALVTGIALAAVALLPGSAAAAAQRTSPAPAHTSSAGVPEHVTRVICTEPAGDIGRLPPEAVPARVCKLVNGWD